MTTSLIEAEQIEAYLTGSAQPGEALLLEAKMIIDPELQDKMNWQKKVHELALAYGRKQLRQEIDNIHRQLFTLPEHARFGNKIRRLFRQR